MKEVFLAWQDSREEFRNWYPVGRLSFDGNAYQFTYTKGAEVAANVGFRAVQPFEDFNGIYESKALFPLFSNRIISPSRKDFAEFISWLNLKSEKPEPLAILARSGGAKPTDTFQVFACPEKDEQGQYNLSFFVHGIRHVSGAVDVLDQLHEGEELELVPEPENKYDQWAVKVANKDQMIGYCPRFVNRDLQRLISNDDACIKARIEKINDSSAPIQYRVLCRVQAKWPDNFAPFSDPEYEPIGTHQAKAS